MSSDEREGGLIPNLCLQVMQQQSSSETEGEGGNAADASSEGDSVGEEEEGKMKSDKVGSKRKKSASSKVPEQLFNPFL